MGDFPPASNPSVQRITPSYLYQEYNGDDNLQSFIQGYNAYAQTYLDYLNNLLLPIYTNGTIVGALLDWVGANLYGIPRPGLPTAGAPGEGPYNTWVYDSLVYDGSLAAVPDTFTSTSDDVYKRVITWLFYKGDGRAFTLPWLKRRIYRFLNGINGTDIQAPVTYQTSDISVAPTGPRAYTIRLTTTPMSTIFAAAVAAGVLELPFQISWTVTLV